MIMHKSSSFASPKQLRAQFPCFAPQQAFIEHSRQQVRDILHYKNPRLLLIVGPCSIHDMRGLNCMLKNSKPSAKR